jgi:hypothetical protein
LGLRVSMRRDMVSRCIVIGQYSHRPLYAKTRRKCLVCP